MMIAPGPWMGLLPLLLVPAEASPNGTQIPIISKGAYSR